MFKKLQPGHKRKIMLAIAASTILLAVASEAKVYLRWGAADNIARWVAGIGGKSAYNAEMTVNGQKATMNVYGLPESKLFWANSSSAISYKTENAANSITAVTLSGTPILFQYQRRDADYDAGEPSFALPRYPQSTQNFYALDKNANMSISVSRSTAAPGQVLDFYHGSMQAKGWQIPLSPTGASTPQGMTFYIRQQEVACIAVERLDHLSETRITMLHKRLEIK